VSTRMFAAENKCSKRSVLLQASWARFLYTQVPASVCCHGILKRYISRLQWQTPTSETPLVDLADLYSTIFRRVVP
jgi:hypothetical protein